LLPTRRLTPHGFSLLWVLFEPVPIYAGFPHPSLLLRVRVWDIIKFSMGHPCPSLIPVQLESGGVHWTVCLCLYRFYMPQSGGVWWSPLDCVLMPLYRFYMPSPVESTRLCAYAFIDFTCSSPVGVQWSLVESAGVQLDYVGERKVLPFRLRVCCPYTNPWTLTYYY